MPLTMRPTGLGSGIDKDRPDYTASIRAAHRTGSSSRTQQRHWPPPWSHRTAHLSAAGLKHDELAVLNTHSTDPDRTAAQMS